GMARGLSVMDYFGRLVLRLNAFFLVLIKTGLKRVAASLKGPRIRTIIAAAGSVIDFVRALPLQALAIGRWEGSMKFIFLIVSWALFAQFAEAAEGRRLGVFDLDRASELELYAYPKENFLILKHYSDGEGLVLDKLSLPDLKVLQRWREARV